jgi:hypothetical protein
MNILFVVATLLIIKGIQWYLVASTKLSIGSVVSFKLSPRFADSLNGEPTVIEIECTQQKAGVRGSERKREGVLVFQGTGGWRETVDVGVLTSDGFKWKPDGLINHLQQAVMEKPTKPHIAEAMRKFLDGRILLDERILRAKPKSVFRSISMVKSRARDRTPPVQLHRTAAA